ncbi:MAG: DUF1554 domain-containing protein [Labilithrix sp.]|nr:DUF1554 domain-containing protein [Labilithrix sp.]
MRLVCFLGVTAVFALGQGCSRATETPPTDEEEPGGTTLGDDDDEKDDTDKKPEGTGEAPVTTPPPVVDDTPPPPPPKSSMTFFVTSVPAGTGGNLGGITGADAKCKELAAAAPIKGDDHTWAAYLSTANENAKDRIGPGPWQNQKGVVVATNVETLHTPEDVTGQLVIKSDLLVDEKGNAIPAEGQWILTGSLLDGTRRGNAHCNNWTANQGNQTGFGSAAPETNPQIGSAWNFTGNGSPTSNCTVQGQAARKSQGRIYCFAKD